MMDMLYGVQLTQGKCYKSKGHPWWCVNNSHTLSIKMPIGLGIDVDLPQVLTIANGTGTENSNLMSRQIDLVTVIVQVQYVRGNLGEDLLSLRTGSEVGL